MTFEIESVSITCGDTNCGITFSVPKRWYDEKRRDHTNFCCPNGHIRHFSGESDEEKLRRERNLLVQRVAEKDDQIAYQRERREATERRLNATRGVVTRIKNRVGHGVCPCCTRSFGNLARHMANQHPDYAQEKLEAAE